MFPKGVAKLRKHEVKQIKERGYTIKQISELLSLNKKTIRYWINN